MTLKHICLSIAIATIGHQSILAQVPASYPDPNAPAPNAPAPAPDNYQGQNPNNYQGQAPANYPGQMPPPPIMPQFNQAPITLQTFYDQLAPYGQWINYPGLGYVFSPSVAPGFQPYSTAGRWTFNEQYGWTWVSDYPWGWATFHYGRWNYDWQYGWLWVPDLTWGPAWVSWRTSGEYYGWAPLPVGATIGFGFSGDYNIRPESWCFVPRERLCEYNLGYFFLPRVHNLAFIQHSYVINRMDFDRDRRSNYFMGPERREVERFVPRQAVPVIPVEHVRPSFEGRRIEVEQQSQPRPINQAPVQQQRMSEPQAPRYEPQRHIEVHQMPVRGIR